MGVFPSIIFIVVIVERHYDCLIGLNNGGERNISQSVNELDKKVKLSIDIVGFQQELIFSEL